MTYYDDIGDAYEWAVKLPVQAVSLDFLGVPGSALGNETAALIEKHGFPSDKRLGAGVVDGRSVFADGDFPSKLVAALQAKASTQFAARSCHTSGMQYRHRSHRLTCLLSLHVARMPSQGDVVSCSACSAHLHQNRDAEAGCASKLQMAWTPACPPSSDAGGNALHWRLQGIKEISVQSSVSLQHLPYNAELETALPKELQSRLAFAKQKVAEIAAAAKGGASSGVSLSKCQPPISEPHPPRLPLLLSAQCMCGVAYGSGNPQPYNIGLTDSLPISDKPALCQAR